MEHIYMDNAATTWPKPDSVYTAVDHFNRELGGNPGRGSHASSLAAGAVLTEAREALAQLFNIHDSSQVSFCHNITMAINMAMKGLLKAGDHVLITSMEHNSVVRPLTALQRWGVEWTAVPCAPDGSLDPDDMRKALRRETRMIAILHASNLTGTIMPIREIGSLARRYEVLFLVDSAQSAGILPLDVEADNIDILCFAGHKALFGLQGTGGLYVRPDIIPRTLIEGGTGSLSEALTHPDFMPDHLEAGTHNMPGICGLLAGISFLQKTGIDVVRQHEQKLCGYIMEGLQEIPGLSIYGPKDPLKRTAVLPITIEGMDCGEVAVNLEYEYGIFSRSGLHCTPLAHQTLGTMKLGLCRLSPGYFNTQQHADTLIRALQTIARQAK